MIEACTCLPCFDSLKCLSPLSSVFSRPVRGSFSVVPSQELLVVTASTLGTLHSAHSLCAIQTLCTAVVVGPWRLALRRLCGKGHDFVWSDAIQDAPFPWLSKGIRLLPEVFVSHRQTPLSQTGQEGMRAVIGHSLPKRAMADCGQALRRASWRRALRVSKCTGCDGHAAIGGTHNNASHVVQDMVVFQKRR